MNSLSSCHGRSRQFCGVVIAILLLMVGCNPDVTLDQPDSEPRTPTVLRVNVTRINRDSSVTTPGVCFGRLRPKQSARLRFARSGTVRKVFKQPGDQVARGDLLAELDNREAEQRKAELEQSLTRAREFRRPLATRDAESARRQIQQLESELQEVEAELARGGIQAPFAGTLSERNIEEAMRVSPQIVAFRLIGVGPPLIELSLPHSQASPPLPDQTFSVQVAGRNVPAVVSSLTPADDSDGGETLLLEFSEDLPDDSWSWDDFVEVRFQRSEAESGFWLPLSALRSDADDSWSVDVVDSDSARETGTVVSRKVEIILLQDDRVLLDGALSDGDLVLADGAHRVATGMRVLAVAETGDAADNAEVDE